MNNWAVYWIRGAISAAILLAGVFGFMWLGSAKPPQKKSQDDETAPVVEVARVDSYDTLDVDVDGEVVAFRTVERSAEVAGVVKSKEDIFQPGSYVEAGTILCRIEIEDYQLEIDRLNQQLVQARANLSQLKQEHAADLKLKATAEEELKVNKFDVERLESIGNAALRTELDQAKRRTFQSQNSLTTVQSRIDLHETREKNLVAAIELANLQLKQAERNKTRTTIKAPFDGVILQEFVEVGGYLQKGARVFSIAETTRVEVKCDLQMEDLYWVWAQQTHEKPQQPGEPASKKPLFDIPETETSIIYQLADRPDLEFVWKGKLKSYDGVGINPNTRTVPCRVVVDKVTDVEVRRNGKKVEERFATGPRQLFPGMFVRASIHTHPRVPLFKVPVKAVTQPQNRVWKFTSTDKAASDEPTDTKVTNTALKAKSDTEDDNPAPKSAAERREEAYIRGTISPITGLQTIRQITDSSNQNFWLIDGSGLQMKAGDQVVLTPMIAPIPNTKVRVPVPTKKPAAKGKEKANGGSPTGTAKE